MYAVIVVIFGFGEELVDALEPAGTYFGIEAAALTAEFTVFGAVAAFTV